MNDWLTAILLLGGVALMVIAGIGLARLPDLFCRSHAVAKAMTLGISLMLLGLWVHLGTGSAGLKVALAIFFQFITIPVAGHLIGKLGFERNEPRWKPRPLADHRADKPAGGNGGAPRPGR
jgi:multicomponent Na+:H+ antiporter subunit G